MRITIACPDTMLDDANQLAMALNGRPDDALTFREPEWRDAAGKLYACASFEAAPDWMQRASAPLARPDWDNPPYIVNLTGAGRAQAALELHEGLQDGPTASPLALVAISGVAGPVALDALGLTQSFAGGSAFVPPHLLSAL